MTELTDKETTTFQELVVGQEGHWGEGGGGWHGGRPGALVWVLAAALADSWAGAAV